MREIAQRMATYTSEEQNAVCDQLDEILTLLMLRGIGRASQFIARDMHKMAQDLRCVDMKEVSSE